MPRYLGIMPDLVFGLFVELEFLFPTILPKRDAVAEFYWLDGQVNAIDFVRLDEHPIDFGAADDRNIAAARLAKIFMDATDNYVSDQFSRLFVGCLDIFAYVFCRMPRIDYIQTPAQRIRLPVHSFWECLKSF